MGESLKKVLKILSYAAAVFVIVYLSYIVFHANYDPLKTEVVTMKTVEKYIETDVFIVRDENVIDSSTSGTVVPLVEDGQRVARGEQIAAVFSSEKEAQKFIKINEIDDEITRYETISNAEKLNIRDIDTYDKSTNDVFNSLVKSISNGEYSEIDSYANSVRDKITSRQISLGESVDASKILSALKSEKQSLGTVNPSYVTADNTGYYINTADGYESTIDYDNVLKVTSTEVRKAISSKAENVPKGTIGKLIDNFNWYMVASVTRNQIDDMKIGDSLKIRFSDAASSDVEASVAAINTDNNGKVALVMKCNKIGSNVSNLRTESAKIITRTIKGYRISKDAIRTMNGINGVYILRGNLINFRRLSLLYTADDYVIARTYEDENIQRDDNSSEIAQEERAFNNTLSLRRREEPQWIINREDLYSISEVLSQRYVKLYDEVIIKGNDLYDKKIV